METLMLAGGGRNLIGQRVPLLRPLSTDPDWMGVLSFYASLLGAVRKVKFRT